MLLKATRRRRMNENENNEATQDDCEVRIDQIDETENVTTENNQTEN